MNATFNANSNVETDPNDDYYTSDKLKIDTTHYGVMAEENTSDYYYFKAGASENF